MPCAWCALQITAPITTLKCHERRKRARDCFLRENLNTRIELMFYLRLLPEIYLRPQSPEVSSVYV